MHIYKHNGVLYISLADNSESVYVRTVSVASIEENKFKRYFWSAHNISAAGKQTEMPIAYGSSRNGLQTDIAPLDITPGKYLLSGEAFTGNHTATPQAFSEVFCIDTLLNPVDATQCK